MAPIAMEPAETPATAGLPGQEEGEGWQAEPMTAGWPAELVAAVAGVAAGVVAWFSPILSPPTHKVRENDYVKTRPLIHLQNRVGNIFFIE